MRTPNKQPTLWNVVRWIALGLSAGLVAGFVTGLLRRRAMAESETTYAAPRSADDRTVGQHRG